MLKLLLVYFATLEICSASFFSHCITGRCRNSTKQRELSNFKGLIPNEEELKRICPLLISSLECYFDEVRECTGHNMTTLAASSNTSVAKEAQDQVKLHELTVELCDEETQIHKDYVENVECFLDVMEKKEGDAICGRQTHEIYQAFRGGFGNDSNGNSTEDSNEDPESRNTDQCIKTAYYIACIAVQLQKNCSEGAKNVLLSFAAKGHVIIQNPCTPASREILKGEFLDFLNAKEDREDFDYLSVFSLLRRK